MKKRLYTGLGVFLVLAIILAGSGWMMFLGVRNLKAHGKQLAEAYKNQNLDQIKQGVELVQGDVNRISFYSKPYYITRYIPFVGGYIGDGLDLLSAGKHELQAINILVNKISPYKEELGFNGTPVAGQDRISQGVKILQKVSPSLDEIQPYLDSAAKDVADINPDKYPEEYKSFQVRNLVKVAKDFITGASVAIKDNKEGLLVLPQILGSDSPKHYMLLFQNDKELRATGGFMTAFADLEINKGKINTDVSDDIYRLDEQLLKVCRNKICPLTPPLAIVKYLPEFDGKPRKAWSMRDSNLSPDVPTSAQEFEKMYRMLGQGLSFDGIIYIDTKVVEEILRVTGAIEVYGVKYSSDNDPRCNCPNIIYELEHYAEIASKGEADRKAILGVLMQQIMARALGADVQQLPILARTVVELANQKHILFYMHDAKIQQAADKLNWTGRIKSYDGDYLHINDSNFAGGKSNLYVEQTVSQEIKTSQDGKTLKRLTIEYKNPQPFGLWLNGINRDYVRVYVPKGSKLISSKGSNDKVNTLEELDKTVFDAFITVNPQNYRVLSFEYEIPYNPSGDYKLLIQKQPGAKNFQYKVNFKGRPQPEFSLISDKELRL